MAVEGQSRRYAALPFLQAASDPGLRPLTRPLPGANIETCRYAAARRYAPFLCGGFDVGLSRSYLGCLALCAFSFVEEVMGESCGNV